MFTVVVQKLKFMIAVIFAFSQRSTGLLRTFSDGTWISCKKINASSFLLPTTFSAHFVFHLYVCQSLPTLQRGLSATADLLVIFSCFNVFNVSFL